MATIKSIILFLTMSFSSLAITKVDVIDSALLDLTKLEKSLNKAQTQAEVTKQELSKTKIELTISKTRLDELQSKIDETTLVITQLKQSLDKQETLNKSLTEKYNKAHEDLWFWRKIGLAFFSVILVCIAGLIIKFYFKLKLPI